MIIIARDADLDLNLSYFGGLDDCRSMC